MQNKYIEKMVAWIHDVGRQKIFYNRSVFSAALWNTLNVFQTPLLFCTTQIINPLLNSRLLANHEISGLSQSWNPYTP